jgi:hypothetical protein
MFPTDFLTSYSGLLVPPPQPRDHFVLFFFNSPYWRLVLDQRKMWINTLRRVTPNLDTPILTSLHWATADLATSILATSGLTAHNLAAPNLATSSLPSWRYLLLHCFFLVTFLPLSTTGHFALEANVILSALSGLEAADVLLISLILFDHPVERRVVVLFPLLVFIHVRMAASV